MSVFTELALRRGELNAGNLAGIFPLAHTLGYMDPLTVQERDLPAVDFGAYPKAEQIDIFTSLTHAAHDHDMSLKIEIGPNNRPSPYEGASSGVVTFALEKGVSPPKIHRGLDIHQIPPPDSILAFFLLDLHTLAGKIKAGTIQPHGADLVYTIAPFPSTQAEIAQSACLLVGRGGMFVMAMDFEIVDDQIIRRHISGQDNIILDQNPLDFDRTGFITKTVEVIPPDFTIQTLFMTPSQIRQLLGTVNSRHIKEDDLVPVLIAHRN